jgi:hypothetical protein
MVTSSNFPTQNTTTTMTNPFDIPSAICDDAIDRIAKNSLVAWSQRITFSYQTTRTMQDIQISLNDARIALRDPNRNLLFRNLLEARNDIMAVIKQEENNAQIAWQRFAFDNLCPSLRQLDAMLSLFDYEITVSKLDEANAIALSAHHQWISARHDAMVAEGKAKIAARNAKDIAKKLSELKSNR